MIEQAAYDRNLFQNSKGSHAIELRYPEYVLASIPFYYSFESLVGVLFAKTCSGTTVEF